MGLHKCHTGFYTCETGFHKCETDFHIHVKCECDNRSTPCGVHQIFFVARFDKLVGQSGGLRSWLLRNTGPHVPTAF